MLLFLFYYGVTGLPSIYQAVNKRQEEGGEISFFMAKRKKSDQGSSFDSKRVPWNLG